MKSISMTSIYTGRRINKGRKARSINNKSVKYVSPFMIERRKFFEDGELFAALVLCQNKKFGVPSLENPPLLFDTLQKADEYLNKKKGSRRKSKYWIASKPWRFSRKENRWERPR